MELSITKKTEKPLLSRVEVYGEITFTGKTPSKEDVFSKLASALKAPKDMLVIKKITQIYGIQKAEVLAYVYRDADSLKQFEPVKKEKKEKEGQNEKSEQK